jgi:hypothetical protein
VGDDVFAEDPTVKRLEDMTAGQCLGWLLLYAAPSQCLLLEKSLSIFLVVEFVYAAPSHLVIRSSSEREA